jgi:hypothetical protein
MPDWSRVWRWDHLTPLTIRVRHQDIISWFVWFRLLAGLLNHIVIGFYTNACTVSGCWLLAYHFKTIDAVVTDLMVGDIVFTGPIEILDVEAHALAMVDWIRGVLLEKVISVSVLGCFDAFFTLFSDCWERVAWVVQSLRPNRGGVFKLR